MFAAPAYDGRRPSPAAAVADAPLNNAERRRSARLLRVNHCGEVCAQALYRGQALTARQPELRATLYRAAREEGDHLRWCRQRLDQLDGHSSRLNPLFYIGSLTMGAAAGLAGDRWSLGFLAETERQVEQHLDNHLQRLPAADIASREILSVMQADEARHADTAIAAGGAALPAPARHAMKLLSKVMTRTTYWV